MSQKSEIDQLASAYRWSEIFEGTPFLKISERRIGSVEAEVWSIPGYTDGLEFLTADSSNELFIQTQDGTPLEVIDKSDIIRIVYFQGNHRLARKHLSTGVPLSKSLLPELANYFQDEFMWRIAHLPVRQRKYHDPMLMQSVLESMRNREASDEARRMLQEREYESGRKTPKSMPLTEFLSFDLSAQKWLVEGLIPVGGNCSVVAAMKTGKSTFVWNLIHSLVTLEPLLGTFEPQPFQGSIGFVNFELTRKQCQEWFKRIPLVPTNRVHVWNLRGEPNPFRSEQSIRDFEQEVRDLDIRVMILDPWSSLFVGDTNSNDEVKKFWLRLDEFKVNSGVGELVIPIHAGRDVSKSRGASSLDDHPDSIIHITRHSDGTRTFRAIGRDVNVPEGELDFDEVKLLLSYKGPSTAASKTSKLISQIRKLFESHSQLSATQIYAMIPKGKMEVQAARQAMVDAGELIETIIGPSKLYTPSSTPFHSHFPASQEVPGSEKIPVSSAISREPESLTGFETIDRTPECVQHSIVKFDAFGLSIQMCSVCDFVYEAHVSTGEGNPPQESALSSLSPNENGHFDRID